MSEQINSKADSGTRAPGNAIIVGRAIVADDWQVLRTEPQAVEGGDANLESAAPAAAPGQVVVPAGKVIVPLKVWQAQRNTLAARAQAGQLGVWLAPDEAAEELRGDSDGFAVIAIDFPKFSDGRGYSIAHNLRARLGYRGQLRAIGDVLRDQLFYMQRVGFDAFAPRPDRSIEDALKGLSDFSETYQASWDQPQPLYRRHARHVTPEAFDVGADI